MTKSFLINDGYTRTVGFDACDDFDEFDFEYRPLRGLELSDASIEVLLERDGELRRENWYAMLEKQVLSWSISQSFAKDLKIVKPTIIGLMTDVVMQRREPDFERDGSGEKIVASTEGEDRGNSSAG